MSTKVFLSRNKVPVLISGTGGRVILLKSLENSSSPPSTREVVVSF
jgi:hypothetical protein